MGEKQIGGARFPAGLASEQGDGTDSAATQANLAARLDVVERRRLRRTVGRAGDAGPGKVRIDRHGLPATFGAADACSSSGVFVGR
jgi:hypothetical protein